MIAHIRVNGGYRKASRPVWWIAGALGLMAGGVVWASGQGKAAALVAGLSVLLPVAAFLADKIAARTGDLGHRHSRRPARRPGA